MQQHPHLTSISELRQQIRRKIRLRMMKMCLRLMLMLGVLQFIAALFYSPHFRVKSVRVTGVRTLSAGQVQFYAQSLFDEPAIYPRTGAVRQRLMAMPGIESVRFGYRPPLGLTVHVTERQPYFLLETQSGQRLVVDRHGVVFQRAHGRLPRYALVQMVTDREWHVGDRLASEDLAYIGDALAVVRRVSLPPPQRFYFDHGFLSLRLPDRTLVRLGSDDWERKLRRVRHAFAFLQQTGQVAEYLDFTSLDVPTWKVRKVNL